MTDASPRRRRWAAGLTAAALVLAYCVILLGAYTRLMDAGLGCPDWPGCYGQLAVPQTETEIAEANAAYPERPVEPGKAWPEMIHRYFASTLGLLIFALAAVALANRRDPSQPQGLPVALAGLVIFQGLLGMWTVTMGLHPLVVMGHLLGGFATLALLFSLSLRLVPVMAPAGAASARRWRPWVVAGLVVLIAQIALGGWTSANYASVACTELPICEPGWPAKLDFGRAFQLWGHGVSDYEFGILAHDARVTIHVSHRFGALACLLYLGGLAAALLARARAPGTRKLAALMSALLVAQLLLGAANVLWQLPLAIAVAHNGGAALLLLALVALLDHLKPEPRSEP